MSDISSAQVTMSLSALNEIQERERALRNEISALKESVAKAERGTPDLALLGAAFDQAMTIVRYAVANLPARESPGWPWAELRWLAEHLAALPGLRHVPSELPITFLEVSRQAEKWTKAYADGTAADLKREDNEARATGGFATGGVLSRGTVQ